MSRSCPQCSETLQYKVYCPKCDHLYETDDPTDYFGFLDLPETFSPDPEEVEERYEDLISILHPDLFENSSPDQKNLSLKLSAMAKTARDTVNSVYSRSIHILSRLFPGVSPEAKTDAAFAMEIFELSEELTSDEKVSEQRQAEIQSMVQNFFHTYIELGNKLLENGNAESPDRELMLDMTGKLKYWINIENILNQEYPS